MDQLPQDFGKMLGVQFLIAMRHTQEVMIGETPGTQFGARFGIKLRGSEQDSWLPQVFQFNRIADTPRGAAASSGQAGNRQIGVLPNAAQHTDRSTAAVAFLDIGVNRLGP